MESIRFQTLEEQKLEIVYEAFVDAFSDYQMPIDLSLSDFQSMMQRRGYCPSISFGAFSEEGRLIGFILNGLRQWNGRLTAYDTGTGVRPAHRKQGITSRLFRETVQALTQSGAEQYVLEVLKNNPDAFRLYTHLGFSVQRSFSIFRLSKAQFTCKEHVHCIEYTAPFTPSQWQKFEAFCDCLPAWQNAAASLHATNKELIWVVARDGDTIIGYGIAERTTGDVPQIAVHSHYRRRGAGGAILTALVQKTDSPCLRFVNVDDNCESMKLFLTCAGCDHIGSQYELMLPLTTE